MAVSSLYIYYLYYTYNYSDREEEIFFAKIAASNEKSEFENRSRELEDKNKRKI